MILFMFDGRVETEVGYELWTEVCSPKLEILWSFLKTS